jgi:hypothetical protein
MLEDFFFAGAGAGAVVGACAQSNPVVITETSSEEMIVLMRGKTKSTAMEAAKHEPDEKGYQRGQSNCNTDEIQHHKNAAQDGTFDSALHVEEGHRAEDQSNRSTQLDRHGHHIPDTIWDPIPNVPTASQIEDQTKNHHRHHQAIRHQPAAMQWTWSA